MAAPTIAEIKTRIETLADSVVTTLLTGDEQRISSASLPAIEARPGELVSVVRNGARIALKTRRWELWLFVREVAHIDKYDDVTAALEACYPYLDTVADYFRLRPKLEDANMQNSLVNETTLMLDSGPVTTPYKDNKTYSAVRFPFNVVTMHN